MDQIVVDHIMILQNGLKQTTIEEKIDDNKDFQ